MRVRIVAPETGGARTGNRVTALRWARTLRSLGHRVRMGVEDGDDADVLVALHARRTHEAIARWRTRRPHAPLVVALTGTDVYRDIHRSAQARESLAMATRCVVLQPAALEELAPAVRRKTRVIFQSARPP